MSKEVTLQRKMITIFLSLAMVFLGVFALLSIERLQGNARVINYAGVVRGGTQRLVKEELQGKPNDQLMEHLDQIIEELLTGDGDLSLVRLDDEEFQRLMAQIKTEWKEIKKEIQNVRRGGETETLFNLSEEHFKLADQTVAEAENYTKKNVRSVEICFIILIGVFSVVSCFLIWFASVQNRRQKELQKAEAENQKKREQLSKMTKELQVPINEISELIYVSDLETYDLLFMNEAGKKSFHVDHVENTKCYKVLHGREEPCPFCTNRYLKPGENYSWETTNAITGRHYMLKDRMIEWDGKHARLEIAFDMTLLENEKLKLEHALEAEKMIMKCIQILYQGQNLEEDVLNVLQNVCRFLGGERTYIISFQNGKAYTDLEWCAEGIESQKEMIQGFPLSIFERWIKIFNNQECMFIDDLEEYKESSPQEYKILAEQGIKSLAAAPMEMDGVLVGCLGVDNPPADNLWHIDSLLQTLCYFILLAYKRAENENLLSRMSFHDNLTSFYNRNRFTKDLESFADNNGAVGILYLDVNGLKEVNDRYGHASGDSLLIKTSEKIKNVFDKGTCYRIGGDEFVVICTNVSKKEFEEKVTELKRSFKCDNQCNAAIGTEWAGETMNIRQVVANADARMYEDKKEFYRQNKASRRYRHSDDEVMKLADPEVLQKEITRRQFIVYLQPKISSSDRSAVGAEALIRYQSRDGSLVLPGNFLPVLEEARSISLIDFYVFDFVCSKIREWSQEGKKGFPVSVNFSRYSLIQPFFVERLKEICEKYEISPTCLEIEITESVRDVNEIDIGHLIVCLRQEGFWVTIDDFGTEYANLALLSSVDFDVLKLDRSMVKDIIQNPKARSIIESIVGICKDMGIQLVAEGIEEEEQLEVLQSCGVELVQGYLFSKPIPIEEYEKKYL